MPLRVSVITLFFFFSFTLVQQTVFACSCGPEPTVLEAYEDSELVIIARVVSIDRVRPAKPDSDDDNPNDLSEEPEEDEDDEEPRDDYDGVRTARMVVEKVYKGNVKVGDEITFGHGSGSDCISTYDEEDIGDKYLLYLRAPSRGGPYSDDDDVNMDAPLRYYSSYCGRNSGFERAVDDLAYLNNIKRARGRTRISGVLRSYSDDNGPNVAKVKVRIIGNSKTYETVTDKHGFYEIYDLPAGKYYIEPLVQKGWRVNEKYLDRYLENYGRYKLETKNRVPVDLQAKGHGGTDLSFTIDNEIRGKVLSPVGKPMTGVCITAVSTGEKEGKYYGRNGCTDEKGEYKIEMLSPDSYILVVNPDGKLNSESPFGVLFYPGVVDRKQAGVFIMSAAKFVTDANIQIPKLAELIEISGKLLNSDDKPVIDGTVEFKPDQKDLYRDLYIHTDSAGNFTMTLPKGAAGKIVGRHWFSDTYLKDCPRVQEMIQEITMATGTSTMFTERIEITGNENIPDLKLTFPFPSCAKAKE